MSDTPRTDTNIAFTDYMTCGEPLVYTYASFSRQLEAELVDKDMQLTEAHAEVERWKGECHDLLRMAHEMRAEIDYFQTLIDLQHKRTVEADKLWQTAHDQPDVWPDLGVLIEWLLLRLKNQETIIEANRATIKDKDALIEQMREWLIGACQGCGFVNTSRCDTCRVAKLLEAAERGE